MNTSRLLQLPLLAAAAAATSGSARAVTLTVNTFVAAGDNVILSLDETYDSDYQTNESAGIGSSLSSSSSGSMSYPEEMSFTGSGSASASFGMAGQTITVGQGSIPASAIGAANQNFGHGSYPLLGPILGTHASGALSNTFHNPDYFDSGGTPNYFTSWAEASFSDRLSYAAPQSGSTYTSIYHFHISGTVTGSEAFIYLELTHGTNPSQTYFFGAEGDYDFVISSSAVQHGFQEQEISLRLLSSFQADTAFHLDGSDVEGTSSFGSTVGLIGIELRDEAGNLAPEDAISGTAGSTYSVVVPEPSSGLLMGASSLLLLSRRKRMARSAGS